MVFSCDNEKPLPEVSRMKYFDAQKYLDLKLTKLLLVCMSALLLSTLYHQGFHTTFNPNLLFVLVETVYRQGLSTLYEI